MSYEAVIEQIKTLPESLLTSVSAFIKLLETEQGELLQNKQFLRQNINRHFSI